MAQHTHNSKERMKLMETLGSGLVHKAADTIMSREERLKQQEVEAMGEKHMPTMTPTPAPKKR